MNKFLLSVLLIAAISAAAFAQTIPETEKSIYPYPYYNDDFPDVLVMKGVAVSGEDVKSAVFLATDKEENYKFRNNYLLVDGKSHELGLEDFKFDQNTRTAVLRFTADDDKIFKLVIKIHRFNYQDIATGSGVFDGHILNLRLVGDYEQIYRIMQHGEPLTTEKPLPVDATVREFPTDTPTSEEIAAIEEALK